MADESTTPRVLIVDDDAGQRSLLCTILGDRQIYDLVTADSGEAALKALDAGGVDLMVCDVRMPGMSGIEVLKRARERFPALPVLLVTAYADIRDAVGAMRDGALNYLEKPIDLDELLALVAQATGLRADGHDRPDVAYDLPETVVAQSPAMRAALREAALIAGSDSRVLITGESGTGKEVIADLIHAWSPRAGHPLIKVNCAALPEPLLESELFGHERGSFTGAESHRIGRFEEASGGTILLDEVAEMSPALQAKLLRVTQDGTFQRVGSNVDRASNARILAATNRELDEEVVAGRFREDLFYRLNVVEIMLPPLRERPADILPLAHHFVAQFSSGKARLSVGAMNCLALYRWPGNVRELANAMKRAVLMARGGMVLPEDLPKRVRDSVGIDTQTVGQRLGRIPEMEQLVILQTLKEKGYNRTETAKALGISRRALIYKLRELADQGFDIGP